MLAGGTVRMIINVKVLLVKIVNKNIKTGLVLKTSKKKSAQRPRAC